MEWKTKQAGGKQQTGSVGDFGVTPGQGLLFRRKMIFRTFPETENDWFSVFFPDFSIEKRFEIQILVFDIFRPDFGIFRPENVVGDRKL